MALKTVDLLMRNVSNTRNNAFHNGPITRGRQNLNFRFKRKIFYKIDATSQLIKLMDKEKSIFCPMEIQKIISKGNIRMSRPSKKVYREV